MSEPDKTKTDKQRQLDKLDQAAKDIAGNAVTKIQTVDRVEDTDKVDHVKPSLAATVCLRLLQKVANTPFEAHGIAENVASRSDTDRGISL